MKLVVIESPFRAETSAETEANVAYARACMADSIARGEAPIASHLLYTQPGILDDAIAAERARGIEAGLAWGRHAELTAVYVDRGWSEGMRAGVNRALSEGRPVEKRSLTR